MRHRLPTLFAVSLALVAGGTAPVSSQIYRMLSSRVGDPSELRLWEVTVSGELTQIDLQTTRDLVASHHFHVDPFGRFLVYPHAGVEPSTGESAVDVYELSSDGIPAFRSQLSRVGWQFEELEHTLTPDGRHYVTMTQNLASEPDTWHYEAFALTASLDFVESPNRLQIAPNGPPNVFAPDRVGSVALPDGSYLLLSTSRQSTGYVSVLPVTASGEVQGLTQQFAWPLVQPLTAGVATRLDQRVIVTGPMGTDRLTSFAVSPGGRLSIIDAYDRFAFGGLSPRDIVFHPTGLSILSGGFLQSIPIERSGEFPRPVFVGPGDGSGTMAVSPDGQIGVAVWDADAEGIHWGVFALTPTGGIDLIRDYVLPFSYNHIAFIPPRTEDVLGDANADARRDAADVVTYLNHFNDPGTLPEWHPLSPRIRGPVPEARADADQDGEITAKDLDWLIDFLLSASVM